MVRIIVDTATDLPPNVMYEYNLTSVPTRVRFGDEIFKVGIDLDDNEFYEMLSTSDYFPKTVHAPPRDFYNVFSGSREETIYLSISRKLSKYYDSAVLAKNNFRMNHVTVYDTDILSMATGMMAITASKMARLGYSLREIIQVLDQMKKKAVIYLAVPTLQYLYVSGRVNRSQLLSGRLLNIKPILRVADGEIVSGGRASGMKRAIEEIPQLLSNDFNKADDIMMTILHSNNLEGAFEMNKSIQSRFSVVESYESRIGSSIGANVGPGAVGIAVVPSIRI